MSATAQFGFFDQMFGNQGHQQHQEPQNVRSDSQWYQAQYEGGESLFPIISYIQAINSHIVIDTNILPAQCTHYLCPGTLSCVHFPHHCPCAWEGVEDKAELGDGIAICGSKGGWQQGEFARKVELARKGVL